MNDDELKEHLKELMMIGFNAGYTFAIEELKHENRRIYDKDRFLDAIYFLNMSRKVCVQRYKNGLN